MKHLVIGDLHGKDCWKQVKPASWDKLVFIGDYVDHWDLPEEQISENLLEVIALKQKHPEKVELLLGNHDVQYLYYPDFRCTGYRPQMQIMLKDIFYTHRELFRVAYQRGNYLFSHAGVTNAWYIEFCALPIVGQIRNDGDTLADLLNKADQTASGRDLLFRAGRLRGGWGAGGITWADKRELLADALDGYNQVVGHSITQNIEVHKFEGKSVVFTDVLDYGVKFYEIDL